MSPREAGQSVASWVTALPKLKEGAGSILGLVAILVALLAGFNRYYKLPERQDATEARVGALEARDARQDSAITAHGNGMEYLICDRLTSQGMSYHGRRTQQECAAEMIGRAP